MCFTWAEENQFSSDFCPLLSEKTFKMFYINQLFCGNLQSPFHRYYRHFRIFFAWENVFVFPLSTNPLLMSVSAVWKLMKIKKNIKSISTFPLTYSQEQSTCLLQEYILPTHYFFSHCWRNKSNDVVSESNCFLFFLDKQSAATILGTEHPRESLEWRRISDISHRTNMNLWCVIVKHFQNVSWNRNKSPRVARVNENQEKEAAVIHSDHFASTF